MRPISSASSNLQPCMHCKDRSRDPARFCGCDERGNLVDDWPRVVPRHSREHRLGRGGSVPVAALRCAGDVAGTPARHGDEFSFRRKPTHPLLDLHQCLRAMAWLGEEQPAMDRDGRSPFAPRCKGLVEERCSRTQLRRISIHTQLVSCANKPSRCGDIK